MSALESQVVEPQELIPLTDYQFLGDSETVTKKCKAVEGYRLKASVYHAAQYAGCGRASIYRWLDNDPEFAQAMADSHEDAADVMESSTYEEALGTNGKPGNPLLKMFWLKAHRPKYRDRVQVDIPSLQEEINQRMEQLGLRELPALTTTITDDGNGNSTESLQILDQPASEQKED